MVVNKADRDIPQSYAGQYSIYEEESAHIDVYQEASRVIKSVKPRETKLSGSIREAIGKVELKDGMTTSFHHHFREGDYVMDLVLAKITAMGLKNISIAPSSIASVYEPLIEHIKNGVVTSITSSGLRDRIGAVISAGIMESPVVIRSYGGRAWIVAADGIHIDVAPLGVPDSNTYGNVNGTKGGATCGSSGYAMVDVEYANQVIIITDTLVPYPNTPISIPQTDADYAVEIDAISDPDGITKDATRFTKNPKESLIAEYTAKIITHSPYYREGFSSQTGTGGSSLAATRFVREQVFKDDVRASFVLDGVTNTMVKLLEEGLAEKIIDVQDSNHPSAIFLGEDTNHYETDANMYVSSLSKGVVTNQLDTVILSALEMDTDFSVNVITGSDDVIRGVPGGHSDISIACKMSLVIVPFVRGRVLTIIEQVNTVVTSGTSVDTVVTEVDIVTDPKRTGLIDCFKTLDVPRFVLGELRDKACNIVGTPGPIEYGDKAVTLIEYRDGSLIDVVRSV